LHERERKKDLKKEWFRLSSTFVGFLLSEGDTTCYLTTFPANKEMATKSTVSFKH
jgi:hypothetical protein